MGLITMLKVAGVMYKLRKFIAIGVLVESVLRRKMRSSKKSRKPRSRNDLELKELQAKAELLATRAQRYLREAKKQYGKR